MRRRVVLLTAFLVFAGAGWLLAEDITLTTYYPSPRGVYRELRVGAAPTAPIGMLNVVKDGDDGTPAFRVDDAAADTSPFVIDQSGNMGIGFATPTQKVEIRNATLPTNLYVEWTGGSNDWVMLGANVANEMALAVGDFTPLAINAGANAGFTHINANAGNVGIGTTGPADKLQVSEGGDWIMLDPNASTSFAVFGLTGHANLVSNRGLSVNPAQMVILAQFAGNVGIGTGTPGFKLEVAGGDINVATGNVRLAGACHAGPCTSDARLKQNVVPLMGSLDRISGLNPVQFELIGDEAAWGPQHGLMAQDVEKVFPDWVVEGEDGYKKVYYGLQIEMHLIQAVKELKEENDRLESRIAELEGWLAEAR